MAICVECGGLYPGRRKLLGYDICLECGERSAQQEKDRKSQCSAPLFNKGPYGYVASKSVAKDVGR